MAGELKGFKGEIETKMQADKVYFKTSSTVYWGQNIAETILIGVPSDLKVTTLFQRNVKTDVQNISGNFWLTPSVLLSPAKSIEQSNNGNVKVKTIRQFKFTLANGTALSFDEHFRYLKNEDNETVTLTELVAEFELDEQIQDNKEIENNIINQLDDFLMIVSFAERHRCICLGWDFINSESHTKYYRRNLAIPDARKKPSSFEALIDILDFDEFIKQAYGRFIELEPRDLIRQAIQYAIYREDKTIENSFLTLYSAIETLLLYFRRNQQLETVFVSDDEWKDFQKALKQWLKNYPLLSGDKNKTKRSFIYKKIPELNRISFSNAFKNLCKFCSVDLSDLWPIVENCDGISLSEIRHKLVHGEAFDLLQLRSLMAAKEHLQWIVERLILAVLGWPVSKSKVNRDYLSHYMACYKDWGEDQKILSQMRR